MKNFNVRRMIEEVNIKKFIFNNAFYIVKWLQSQNIKTTMISLGATKANNYSVERPQNVPCVFIHKINFFNV